MHYTICTHTVKVRTRLDPHLVDLKSIRAPRRGGWGRENTSSAPGAELSRGESGAAALPESRSTAHGKRRKTHGTAFAVRIFPKRTAKGARLIFTR
jgi:hypothetical protein